MLRHGRIERAFTDVETIHLVPAMQKTLRDYEQYCKDRLQLRPSTLRTRTTELTIFLDFLHSRKARTLDQIQALDLSEFRVFVAGSLEAEDSVANRFGCAFFSSVSDDAWDSAEGSQCGAAENPCSPGCQDPLGVGSRTHRQALGAVDRSSAKGKRDYAILLLACRLGLRAGDIRTLKLDQLHWEDSTIEITQSKTGTPLSLPLTERSRRSFDRLLEVGSSPNGASRGLPQSEPSF